MIANKPKIAADLVFVGSIRWVSLALLAAAVASIFAIIFSASLSERLFEQSREQVLGEAVLTVGAVTGFSGVGSVGEFFVVVNVSPGEQILFSDEVSDEHPTSGELLIDGQGGEVVSSSHHIEAFIYDRSTGLAVQTIVPTIELFAEATGETYSLEIVTMHDSVIGHSDVHFGGDVAIEGETKLTVRVNIESAGEVVVDGYLG